MVQVVVRTEGAQLKFPGRALSTGSMGEEVTMTNPSSGRQFKAVVEGDGLVGVDATAEKKPAGEGKQ
jgi:flagella basal body P-ring formation protein FlgA